ncbi:M15 family metallopeptidase [Paenibacillus naphthalenovorans]|uniref:M15 family metallopeptidase n=1 Tax=Paenibacillus naphthalenovorans TaxID=162209 RepID=UPI003D27EFA3
MNLNMLLSKSEKRISQLNPIVANKTRELIRKSYAEGINILITQGMRTFEEQAELYARGRTKSGTIVTNAKAGYSFHNYGLAIDFCLLADDGVNVLWTVNDKWRRVAEIGKSLGFVWGGDWKGFVDYPHLEMTFGLTINDLLNGKQPPVELEDDIPMLDKGVAQTIINTWISPAWYNTEDQEQKKYLNWLANQLRLASGMKVE